MSTATIATDGAMTLAAIADVGFTVLIVGGCFWVIVAACNGGEK